MLSTACEMPREIKKDARSPVEEEPQALHAFHIRSQLMALRNEDEIWSKYCRVMMGTAEGLRPVAEAQ